MIYLKFFKFVIDFLVSLLILFLTLPILLLITIITFVVFIENPFFIQTRTGQYGKTFKLLKFRSMRDLKDEYGNSLPDNIRINSWGKFLRAFSLDELPQLFNVLKGEMSLVGPRPLLPKYLPLYNDFQRRRLEVKPGVTGWTQVNGRNSLSWEDKFKLDVWYVDNVSFLLDLKILFLTIVKVFKREGINSEGSVSGIPFTGNKTNS